MIQKKKRQLIIILIMSGILLTEIIVYLLKCSVVSAFNFNKTSKAEITDELIISLFKKNITEDSGSFYNQYFSSELSYYNYEYKIKDINRQTPPPFIYITFSGSPMIGAHNPVGDDEITYKVDVFGNKSLVKFNHLKSYDIPPWLKNMMTKPYP